MSKTFIGVVLAVLVLAGSWLAFRDDASPPTAGKPQTSNRPKAPALLDGTWRADGVVTASFNPSQPTGARLVREWMFVQVCAKGRCALWLSRQAADGYESAPVERFVDSYQAVFKVRTEGCGMSRTGELTRRFRISRIPDGTLEAAETVEAAYPGCARDGSVDRVQGFLTWKLKRVSAGCRDLPGCRYEPSASDHPSA